MVHGEVIHVWLACWYVIHVFAADVVALVTCGGYWRVKVYRTTMYVVGGWISVQRVAAFVALFLLWQAC